MDQATYWVLNSVVTYTLHIFWLGAEPGELALMLKGDAHGLSYEDLALFLQQLGNLGDLSFYTCDRADGEEQERVAPTPALDDLRTALVKNMRLWYARTEHGGQRWEAMAQPHWERSSEISALDHVTIMAMAPERGHELLARYPQTRSEEDHIPASIRRDEERPWQAPDWKHCPSAIASPFRRRPKTP